MTEPDLDRRATDVPTDNTARILALAYTVGYFGMVAVLVKSEVPADNHDIVISLVSVMSAVQLHIMGFYFGSSKSAETSQKASIVAKEKADTSLRDIAKAAIPDPVQVTPPAIITSTTTVAKKK